MKKIHYFILCTICLIYSKASAQQWGDFTLYSLKNSTSAYLLDSNHNVAHTWTMAATAKTGYSTYLMPGGVLWRTIAKTGNSFQGGPITGEIQKVDYNGNVLWDFVYSTTTYCTHHDICPLPNGNVLLIAYESKTAAEVAAAGCSTFSGIMWPDKIVEVQQTGATTGNVVWEWHAWDHLVQNTNASGGNYQTSILDHPELININQNAQKDWMHMNGVDYNPMLDQITFSCHNLNEVYVIDHSTTSAEAASHTGGNSGKGGDILYRWGKPSNYGATGTAIINVCHDAHWIKEGNPHAGYLAYYNNKGIVSPSNASCGDFFETPVSGYNYTLNAGLAYSPATYGVRMLAGGYNSNEGSVQELPNGNVLINLGITGVIKEFNATGTLLWSKVLTGSSAKVFKYDSCYVFNTPPAIPTISESSGVLNATTASTYQWYMNGALIANANNQSYIPTQDGIYVVRINDANGCVNQYSVGFPYTLATGLEDNNSTKNFIIKPNPSAGIFNFDYNYFAGANFEYSVYNAYGTLVLSNKNTATVDLSNCANGMYHLVLKSERLGIVSRRLILNE